MRRNAFAPQHFTSKKLALLTFASNCQLAQLNHQDLAHRSDCVPSQHSLVHTLLSSILFNFRSHHRPRSATEYEEEKPELRHEAKAQRDAAAAAAGRQRQELGRDATARARGRVARGMAAARAAMQP